ncbi:MAG: GNAT family N-acetyltransferase [Anaerolineae bacterium]|nr:GNAT family N-acetyltransferase [Anaerolineae bacterium]MCI0607968.1 GNAT family N-acetyltransferase [Anaerolineae bacterium]
MEILRAQAKDADLIAPLFDAYRQFYKAPSDIEASHQFIFERLTNDESVIFLAMEGYHALGFVQLYPLFASVALQALWLLNDLYVDPSARKQGVGERLMKHAEQFAQETGSRGLFLRTATDNYPAQQLYEKCGWVKDDKFYRYDRIVR